MLEAELASEVVKLAKARGWLVHKTRNDQSTRRTTQGSGVPDLFLVHRAFGVAFAELKQEGASLRPEQRRWGEALALCPGVTYWVWRPSDLSSGLIERVLSGARE